VFIVDQILGSEAQGRLVQIERGVADRRDALHDLAPAKMLTQLLSIVRSARPAMPLMPRAIVEAVCLTEGPIGNAQEVARQLGLANRFKLARMLKEEGLPPLHRLAEWAMVESWVLTAEQRGVSLCHIAFRCRKHPSACYRLVREVTGLSWEQVRARGSQWVHRQFLTHVRSLGRSRRPLAVQVQRRERRGSHRDGVRRPYF
jgi:hypothetical protein